MKNLITILFLFCAFGITEAQVTGIDFKIAKLVLKDSDIETETLLKLLNKEKNTYSYLITYDLTPVGLKHCVSKAMDLVALNGMSFRSPSIKDDLFAGYVDGITDYSDLHTSLIVGSSEISYQWILPNNYRIVLSLNDSMYTIYFLIL